MTRILLIDDEEQIRLTTSALLRMSGYEVVTAGGGQEGLELFGRQAFDLVMTDVVMPGMGGGEVIAAVRRIRPDSKIIAVYGGGRVTGGDSLATAQGLGADGLVAKPFTRDELLATVTGVLGAPS